MASSDPAPQDFVRPFRIETWDDGGHVRLLVMAKGRHLVHAWMLDVDKATSRLSFGRGNFRAEGARSVIDAPRDLVASAIPLEPATPDHARLLGVVPPRAGLAPYLTDVVSEGMVPEDSPFLWGPSTRSAAHPYRLRVDQEARFRFQTQTIGSRPADAPGVPWGYVEEPRLDHGLLVLAPTLSLPDPDWSPQPDANLIRFHERREKDDQTVEGLAWSVLMKAAKPIRSFYGITINSFLSFRNWTPQAAVFYAAPGRTGERRRQAGELYPTFAPLIAHAPGVAALVDAGRPFEEALLGIVRGWLPEPERERLTLPVLRRMREVSNDLPYSTLRSLVRHALRMPLDWLPRTKDDWAAFGIVATKIAPVALDLGLDVAEVVRPGAKDWVAFHEAYDAMARNRVVVGRDGGGAILQAHDAAHRLTNTLLAPLARSVDEGVAWEEPGSRGHLRRLAGQILYGGKTVFGILKLSDRWHAGLPQLTAALPEKEEHSTWPALIEPFRVSGGTMVVALTSKADLVAEGGRGSDANGVPGLDHCVGGYGKACFGGHKHILSVRRVLPDGGYERLSTIEYARPPKGDTGIHPIPGTDLVLRQHFGRSNKAPPPVAWEALNELLTCIGIGETPVNPAALERRDASSYDSYDWRDEANLRQAFDAWAPYLPADVASAGIDGLRARIAEGLDALPRIEPEGPALPGRAA